MIVIESREAAALYRKLFLAYLIDTKPNVNAVFLHKETGFPKRTVQNNLADMHNISIKLKYYGSAKDGYYSVESWGLFDKAEVYKEIDCIRLTLQRYLTK